MTNINQLKEKSINYFTLLLNDKSEAIKLFATILFSIYLILKFIGGYDSTGGYDIRSEFCGYLMQFSFFCFLYVNLKPQIKSPENPDCSNQNCSLKFLAMIQLLLSITNFLIVKSMSTFFPLKFIVLYASILMFLVLIGAIAASDNKKPLTNSHE
jgi:hypothetical protein